MRKKLISLAVAGVLAAPFATYAQGSNVQIYGTLRPSLDFVDNGDEKGTFMNSNSSELGFKGSEDLGGGLKAIFQLSSSLEFDERGEGRNWMNRDSWVGLAGAFGSVTVGNHLSAYQRSSAFLDPFSFTVGDYNNIMSIVGSPGSDVDFNSRFKNSIAYASPSFGGLQITGSYALRGEGFEDQPAGSDYKKDDTYSIAAKWTSGPFGAVVAYEKQKNSVVSGDPGNFDPSAWKIGGSFKVLPTTTIYAMVDRIDTDTAADTRTGYYIGAKHSMGSIDLLANFMKAGDTDGFVAGADDDGATAFSLGAVYNFSKRTNMGAYYSQVDNDDDGVYGMDSGYSPAAAGEKVKALSVRLQHRF